MAEGFSWIRLSTIHPALAHFTLGTLPLLILAYGLGLWRRSERWTFVGDAALVVTAGITLFTFAFGLVSNEVVDWPGGLGLWRWLHLGFGAGSTALLLALASIRVVRRQRVPVASRRTLAAAASVAVVVLFTGWLGGEVLVFHAGVAVKGAGKGALAPPVTEPPREPRDLRDAMGRLRPAWADASARLAKAVVHEPTEERYEAIEWGAVRMQEIARWIEANEGTGLAFMARDFRERAADLEHAARDGDVAAAAEALGNVSRACAGCHQSFRWRRAEAVEPFR